MKQTITKVRVKCICRFHCWKTLGVVSVQFPTSPRLQTSKVREERLVCVHCSEIRSVESAGFGHSQCLEWRQERSMSSPGWQKGLQARSLLSQPPVSLGGHQFSEKISFIGVLFTLCLFAVWRPCDICSAVFFITYMVQ